MTGDAARVQSGAVLHPRYGPMQEMLQTVICLHRTSSPG